jgi:hypothetical protein
VKFPHGRGVLAKLGERDAKRSSCFEKELARRLLAFLIRVAKLFSG